MAFLRELDMRTRGRRRANTLGRTVEDELRRISRRELENYDIFLSQTIKDAEIVLGVYDFLVGAGYSVFCDWISAPSSDRSAVTPANAEYIRSTMSKCESLLFLDTPSADQSLWMCWELGWFDGHDGHVAVLPVMPEEASHYRGREFLGLYPYLEIEDGKLKVVRPVVVGRSSIMLFESPNSLSFDHWRDRTEDFLRPRIL